MKRFPYLSLSVIIFIIFPLALAFHSHRENEKFSKEMDSLLANYITQKFNEARNKESTGESFKPLNKNPTDDTLIVTSKGDSILVSKKHVW